MKDTISLLVLTIVLLASVGCANYKIIKFTGTNTSVSGEYKAHSDAEEITTMYRKAIDSVMNEQIGTTAHTLTKGNPEGRLGNFCSDAVFEQSLLWQEKNGMLEKVKLDFALLNNGGLRVPLDSGRITIGNIYELMPFENEIVFVEISGKQMNELMDYIHKRTTLSGRKSGVPVSKNFELQLDTINQLNYCQINDQQFDPNQSYTIATSDYLANGGDQMAFFTDPIAITYTGVKIRDAFIESIRELGRKGQVVDAKLDGRIGYVR